MRNYKTREKCVIRYRPKELKREFNTNIISLVNRN